MCSLESLAHAQTHKHGLPSGVILGSAPYTSATMPPSAHGLHSTPALGAHAPLRCDEPLWPGGPQLTLLSDSHINLMIMLAGSGDQGKIPLIGKRMGISYAQCSTKALRTSYPLSKFPLIPHNAPGCSLMPP